MKTLRIEMFCVIINQDTNDKVVNSISFYRNKNKTRLRWLDRHAEKQFTKVLELIEKKDYTTILTLVQRDWQEQYDQVEVIEKIATP